MTKRTDINTATDMIFPSSANIVGPHSFHHFIVPERLKSSLRTIYKLMTSVTTIALQVTI